MTNGMPPTAATHILLDGGSLYVTGFGRGVFRSDDGGDSWSLKNHGLPAARALRLAPGEGGDGALYLVIARRSERGEIGNELDGALYRSTDRAETWEKVNLPEGVNGPNGLAVDPENPRRLYLAAWARQGARNGGIFLSTDRGASWKQVHDADQHVYDVTIDPRHPSVLYACGFESAAWRSADRGALGRVFRATTSSGATASFPIQPTKRRSTSRHTAGASGTDRRNRGRHHRIHLQSLRRSQPARGRLRS